MAPRAAVLLLAVAVAAAACATTSAQTRLGKLVVNGVVPCNTGTLIDVATSPAFPDAKVELRCGGNVVAGATTSRNGSFAIEMDMTSALAALLGACNLVVDTPLASGGARGQSKGFRVGAAAPSSLYLAPPLPLAKCNATLPAAGTLVSNLQGPLSGMLSGVFRLTPAPGSPSA